LRLVLLVVLLEVLLLVVLVVLMKLLVLVVVVVVLVLVLLMVVVVLRQRVMLMLMELVLVLLRRVVLALVRVLAIMKLLARLRVLVRMVVEEKRIEEAALAGQLLPLCLERLTQRRHRLERHTGRRPGACGQRRVANREHVRGKAHATTVACRCRSGQGHQGRGGPCGTVLRAVVQPKRRAQGWVRAMAVAHDADGRGCDEPLG